MVSTIDIRLEHSKYSESSPDIKEVVNNAFEAVAGVFKSAGLPTGFSDEAEELVAAIHHYYERSSNRA